MLAAWGETLGASAQVVSREEAADDGWFGTDLSAEALARIGDVIAASRLGSAVVATRREPNESKIIGMHGGRTDEEVLVPLAVAHPA